MDTLSTAGGSSRYESAQIIDVTYPSLEAYFMVGKYYIDNLVDEKRFPDWPIENREIFYLQACSHVKKYRISIHMMLLFANVFCSLVTFPLRHQVCILKLIRQQHKKCQHPPTFDVYTELNEWVTKTITDGLPTLNKHSNTVYICL